MVSDPNISPLSALPSVERLLIDADSAGLIATFGRPAVASAVRGVLASARTELRTNRGGVIPDDASLIRRVARQLQADAQPSLRRVFNLTGTVLHTNLGRAALPEEAIEAVALAAREATNLEFDLADGRRGDRDTHLEQLLCRLTGAEAATVVNNNAAAVMLVLNSLANRKEVPTSRGELIEIGGSFRLPDIMARSGCRLREVGTTNRTHLKDFQDAIGAKTGLVMKVHTSNYTIEGFAAEAPEADLARLCHDRGVPFVVDLGSGTLIDLQKFGLPHEPTPAESIANGADLVTFSGDKLLGGPQAGIVVGRADLIERDQAQSAEESASSGQDDHRGSFRGITALLESGASCEESSGAAAAHASGGRYQRNGASAARCGGLQARGNRVGRSQFLRKPDWKRRIAHAHDPECRSCDPAGRSKSRLRKALERIARAFRELPIPVLGRIQSGALIFDLRCLEDEAAFVDQLRSLNVQ